MQIKMIVKIDKILNEIILKEVGENYNDIQIVNWKGSVNGYSYSESFIEIKQSKDDSKLISLKKGSLIEDSVEDIRDNFITEFRNVLNEINQSEFEGIEYNEDNSNRDNNINPYDPELIRVDTRSLSMNYINQMITSEDKELDLSPDFQRNFVWNDITRKSRLIESLLLRIPLPVFYFSQDKEGKYQVIDGVQRLTVIKSFLNNEFKLKNLEYLTECEGKYYKKDEKTHKERMDYIDSKYVRWLNQTQFVCNIIDPQTPSKVKFDIFRRINTGGVGLNPQEIRNCISNTKTRSLLKRLASTDEFKKATDFSVNSTRMADQELVLRFIAFYYNRIINNPYLIYKGSMDEFLDETIEILNDEKENMLHMIEEKFINSMKNAEFLFGKYAFRKCRLEHLKIRAKRQLINKSLFVTLSIALVDYDYSYVSRFEHLNMAKQFANEIEKNELYMDVLTNGTSDIQRLNTSFMISKKIIDTNLSRMNLFNSEVENDKENILINEN